MFNIDYITKKYINERNQNWLQVLDLPYRLIVEDSGWEK